MTNKSENKKADRPKTHSSISVSNKIVCKDEECIGKAISKRNALTGQAERQDKNKGKVRQPGTSMSISGKDACTDESCIGKK